MDFIDLFCGIGGFRLGLERANLGNIQSGETRPTIGGVKSRPNRGDGNGREQDTFNCVWANDNDKYACQIYRKRFGNKSSGQLGTRTRSTECSRPIRSSPIGQGNARKGYEDSNWHEPSRLYEGDIRAIDASAIPEHDLLCAGFPCQSFSIAGKRKGFGDTRGTLFFEICRIIRAKRPSYLLLENVKGLLSHDDGHTFETIIRTLDELGYDLQWQVLNSKDFGVPQNRERVFIIGHTREQSRPKVFPIGEADTVYPETDERVTHAIDSNYHKGWLDNQQRTMIRYPLSYLNRNQRNIEGDWAFTIDSRHTGGIKQDSGIRRLTPLECERLQGFPDGWTEGISDTQRYKCLGNAVTVNVIEAIGRQIIEGLRQ